MPPLDLRLASGQGFLVVSMNGEMDICTVAPIEERLLTIARAVPGVVVLDLADVTFLDSTGCGLFLRMHKILSRHHQLLLLANVRPSVGRPLQILGLDRLMPVTYTEEPVRPWERPIEAEELLRDLILPDDVIARLQPLTVAPDVGAPA